jgi:ABC-type glycerol-3-phosphate transport system permease component
MILILLIGIVFIIPIIIIIIIAFKRALKIRKEWKLSSMEK